MVGLADRTIGIDVHDGLVEVSHLLEQVLSDVRAELVAGSHVEPAVDCHVDLGAQAVPEPARPHLADVDDSGRPRRHLTDLIDQPVLHAVERSPDDLLVDFVKIDRSVIQQAMDGRGARAVLAAILAFADQSGAFVIAEGIENESVLDFVRHTGSWSVTGDLVGGGQGYFLGRPSAELPVAAARSASVA